MLETYDWFLIAAVMVGTVIRYTLGFGFSMLFVPAASLVLGFSEAVGLAIFLELLISLIVAVSLWRHFEWFEAGYLKLAGLCGLLLGQLVLSYVSSRALTIFSMILLIIFASAFLFRPPKLSKNLHTLTLVGVSSGLLNTWASMSGPPIVLYYYSTDRSQVKTKAALNSYFLILYAVSFSLYCFRGYYSTDKLDPFMICSAAMLASLLTISLVLRSRPINSSASKPVTKRPLLYRNSSLVTIVAVATLVLIRTWTKDSTQPVALAQATIAKDKVISVSGKGVNESTSILELLELAEADIEALRLTTPTGENAWYKLKVVLSREPDNIQAHNALQRIFLIYVELAMNAASNGQEHRREIYLARARQILFGG